MTHRPPLLAALLCAAAPAAARVPCPPTARSAVDAYHRAIGQGRFGAAHRLWADGGRASGKTRGQFARGFAATARTRASTDAPGRVEGAAGSLYATVPARVEARLKNGTAQRFAGTYVLRRVNGVPGATAAQRCWRIAAARLRAVG